MVLAISHNTTNPIIVDEDLDISAEAVLASSQELHAGGIGVPTSYQEIMPMSGYQKPQDVVYDYGNATTRPDQAASYTTFAQPAYDSSYMSTHAQVPSGLPNAAELPLMSGDQYQAHDASYSQQNPGYQTFIATAPRQLPEVVTFSPIQGPAGRKLFVYLNAADGLEASTQYITVVFGSRRCTGMLTKLNAQSQQGNYAVSVDVPPFDSTGSSSIQVPLYMDMSDGASASMPVEFGQYNYTDATAYGMTSPSPSLSRKRKLSGDMSVHSPIPGKRLSSQNLRADFDTSSPTSANGMSPFAQNPQPVNYAYGHAVNRPQSYGGMPQTSQATPRYGYSPQSTASHLGVPSSTYSGYGGYVNDRSSAPPSSIPTQSPATSGMPYPALVRTSTLGTDSTGNPNMVSSFNPYTMYPSNSKANLKLDGDLNSMADHWTQDEVQTQRRLVRFRRSQSGSTITATFEPVTPEDHAKAPGNIYVNCIWWKEKGACFITSVDTIQLLESLVAVRFTVEEKNRIRRNLEGFRPATVSKTRPECEEFFKTIMGFPSPKPRNIEKDVKVFPWRILAGALRKIIGKYSASYSSTAASIPPGMAGSASASGSSNGQGRPTASPQSASSHHSSMQYPTHSMAPTTMTSAGPMMGSSGPASSMAQSVSWHQPSANYTTDLSGATRPSWDFSSQFMEGQPAVTAMTAGGPPMRDFRIPSISQQFGFGNLYLPGQDYQRSTQA